MSYVVVRVGGLKELITIVLRELISKLAPYLPAHVTLIPEGGGGSLKYRNLAKRLHPSIAFVRTAPRRFLVGTSLFKAREEAAIISHLCLVPVLFIDPSLLEIKLFFPKTYLMLATVVPTHLTRTGIDVDVDVN